MKSSLSKKASRDLRNKMTFAEIRLWSYLKNSQLAGRKFRRQHRFGYFILDFYCPSEKIAIELDGEPHNVVNIAQKDERRDAFLNGQNVKVIRIENKHIFASA